MILPAINLHFSWVFPWFSKTVFQNGFGFHSNQATGMSHRALGAVTSISIAFSLPSGKHTKNYGKSPFFMGKPTISMAIFNSYVKLPEGI
jgi:hypothetical protein